MEVLQSENKDFHRLKVNHFDGFLNIRFISLLFSMTNRIPMITIQRLMMMAVIQMKKQQKMIRNCHQQLSLI